MNKEQRKYENYLQALRKQVEKLPTKIWEYSDIEDKSYQDKRNYLLQEVMDIRNKLVVYLEKKYGKNVILYKQFQNISFFPKVGVFDTFNEENHKAWNYGRITTLRFVDNLIARLNSETMLENNSKTDVYRWIIFGILNICIILFIWIIPNYYHLPGCVSFSERFLLNCTLISLTSALIWIRNWKALVPIFVAFLIGYITILKQ